MRSRLIDGAIEQCQCRGEFGVLKIGHVVSTEVINSRNVIKISIIFD